MAAASSRAGCVMETMTVGITRMKHRVLPVVSVEYSVLPVISIEYSALPVISIEYSLLHLMLNIQCYLS